MARLPPRTSTFFGSFVNDSISPVPKASGPPGYDVPRVNRQSAEFGRPLPSKLSRKVVCQVGAAAAATELVDATPNPNAATAIPTSMMTGLDRKDMTAFQAFEGSRGGRTESEM